MKRLSAVLFSTSILLAGAALAAPPDASPIGPTTQSAPHFERRGPPSEAFHQRIEAEWAQCKAMKDPLARATCYEGVHDRALAEIEKHRAEHEEMRAQHQTPPPPAQ